MPQIDSRIKTGKLRHRIELVQVNGADQDESGGIPVSFTTSSPLITLWAQVEAWMGRKGDFEVAAEIANAVTHIITVRYQKSLRITASMQVWFHDRVFQIVSVFNPDETTKKVVLLCTEINDSSQQQGAPTPNDLG